MCYENRGLRTNIRYVVDGVDMARVRKKKTES
jgi:hypothetical protein